MPHLSPAPVPSPPPGTGARRHPFSERTRRDSRGCSDVRWRAWFHGRGVVRDHPPGRAAMSDPFPFDYVDVQWCEDCGTCPEVLDGACIRCLQDREDADREQIESRSPCGVDFTGEQQPELKILR